MLAGLLHLILEAGWQDHSFCDRYADDVAALQRAVASFTPAEVARRADVPEATLREAARLFAHDCHSGPAAGSTGADMAPGGNLAEHLIECLNIVCGRYLREGAEIETGDGTDPVNTILAAFAVSCKMDPAEFHSKAAQVRRPPAHRPRHVCLPFGLGEQASTLCFSRSCML